MTKQPVFNVGDTVRCARQSEYFGDFDFTGQVISRNNTGDEWEYAVTNAPAVFPDGPPLLVWESEMTHIKEAP